MNLRNTQIFTNKWVLSYFLFSLHTHLHLQSLSSESLHLLCLRSRLPDSLIWVCDWWKDLPHHSCLSHLPSPIPIPELLFAKLLHLAGRRCTDLPRLIPPHLSFILSQQNTPVLLCRSALSLCWNESGDLICNWWCRLCYLLLFCTTIYCTMSFLMCSTESSYVFMHPLIDTQFFILSPK